MNFWHWDGSLTWKNGHSVVDKEYWKFTKPDTNPKVYLLNQTNLIKTDTFKSGYGANFDRESTGEHFTLSESLLHINVLELKVVFLDLKVYVAI